MRPEVRAMIMKPIQCRLACALYAALAAAGFASTAIAGAPTGDGVATGAGTDFRWSTPAQADVGDSVLATFSYYNILGSALRPRNSANTYAYTANGCLYVTSGTVGDRLQFPLLIPDDSVIKYLRFYYVDTNATDMTAWITRYLPGQSSSDVGIVSSSGSAGFGTALSTEITHSVDNAGNYTINVGWNANDTTQQICGVRVAFYAPTLFRNGFE
jgi:hypothetical protein